MSVGEGWQAGRRPCRCTPAAAAASLAALLPFCCLARLIVRAVDAEQHNRAARSGSHEWHTIAAPAAGSPATPMWCPPTWTAPWLAVRARPPTRRCLPACSLWIETALHQPHTQQRAPVHRAASRALLIASPLPQPSPPPACLPLTTSTALPPCLQTMASTPSSWAAPPSSSTGTSTPRSSTAAWPWPAARASCSPR